MFRRPICVMKIPHRKCTHLSAERPGPTLTIDDIPAPRGLPFIGSTFYLLAAGSTARLHEYIDARHRSLGCIFRDNVGPVNAVFLSNADHMRSVFSPSVEGKYPVHILPDAWALYNEMYDCKRGLFFMNGEEWWRFRRITNKLLMRDDLAWLHGPIQKCTKAFIDGWGKDLKAGEPKILSNLENELYRLSIDVMVATLVGSMYEQSRQKLDAILVQLSPIVQEIFVHSAKLAILPAKISAKILPAWSKFVNAADNSMKLATALVDKILDDCPEGDGLIWKFQQENVSREDITRIVADLIMAAGDTTAYTTQWALYLLAQDLEKQEAVRENILTDGVLVKGVLKEALRLYPVAPFITRILSQDSEIAGYHLPQGTILITSLVTSGRDYRNFPSPTEFLPERWTRDANNVKKGVLKAHGSMPFGMGSRSCVGQRVAVKQINLTLTSVLKNFVVELANTNDQIKMKLRMVSVPSKPIRLKITAVT